MLTTQVTVLRVFTDADGGHGNPLGVVDGASMPKEERQAVAAALGFSETVFVDDAAHGRVEIYTPASARARMFAPGLGIVEDEATGAAAIALTARLRRDPAITQGRGSRLSTRWEGDDMQP